MSKAFFVLATLTLLAGELSRAAAQNEAEERALQQRAADFVAAFNRGDAAAVAAFWTADGDYVDQFGHALRGRKAIEAAFRKQFADAPGAKLRIIPATLRWVKPDLAIEDGAAEVFPASGGPPAVARYT